MLLFQPIKSKKKTSRELTDARFPALGVGCMFSRARHCGGCMFLIRVMIGSLGYWRLL